MKLWIVTQLWKINYIRRRWCWAEIALWAMRMDGKLTRVDPACDYCGNCKNKDSEG